MQQEKGGGGINSHERRVRYQFPQIKRLAPEERRAETRRHFKLWLCFEQNLLLSLRFVANVSPHCRAFCVTFHLFCHSCSDMIRGIVSKCFRDPFETSSNGTSTKKFSVFMPMCVLNCRRQQTVIPLSLPCMYVCVCVCFC